MGDYGWIWGDYGLNALREFVLICCLCMVRSLFLEISMSTCLILVIFWPFSDLLETFMLHNVAILPTIRVSGKLLDLFLVSVPAGVSDFYQMAVPWSDQDMLFLSCHLERPREVAELSSIRRFRDVDQSELVAAAELLDR
jgi:hypothetical protein